MLITLLVACALGQPPTTDAPKPAPPPAAAESPKAPTPLTAAGVQGLTDVMIGRGIGGYNTALQMLGWAADANPGDAQAVARTRERWEAEAKPGYEALVTLMARRKGVDEAQVIAELEPVMRKDLDEVKSKLTPAIFHTMIVEQRLEVRDQPAEIAAYWYMFDPARAGDDTKLTAAGKVRKVRATLAAEGGKNAGLEVTLPLSWGIITDKPGLITVAENAGVGPLTISINAFPLPRQAERDPVKLVAIMATTPENPHPETVATTLAGRPAGRGSRLIITPSNNERICGLYTFTVSTEGELAVSVAATVAAPARKGERDYTREELAAYAQRRAAVTDAVFASMTYVDLPVTPPAPQTPTDTSGSPAAPAK